MNFSNWIWESTNVNIHNTVRLDQPVNTINQVHSIIDDFENIPRSILNKITKNKDGYYQLAINKFYKGFIELPQGYGYKWWAARLLLELNIWKISSEIPRDLDITRYIDDEPEKWLDNKLAEKYMPDDFKHWNWVEKLEDNYFESRDFTINEVFYKEGKLIFTKEALLDIFNNTIRATETTFNYDYQDHEFSTVIKALRLYVNYKERFWSATLEFLNPYQLEDTYVNLFWIALNLDKANEVSEIQAYLLMEKLIEIWKIPNHISSLEQAREYIEKSWQVHNFEFRTILQHNPLEAMFANIEEWYNNYKHWNIDLKNLDTLPFRWNKKIR